MQYPYSKQEGGIILSIIFIVWGLGAYFQEMLTVAYILGGLGVPLLLVLLYLRYIRK
jgi:hypothetical protein